MADTVNEERSGANQAGSPTRQPRWGAQGGPASEATIESGVQGGAPSAAAALGCERSPRVNDDRRAWPRISTCDRTEMASGRVRPGRTAQIVDLSPGGALIETDWRLLPGMRLELQLGEPVAQCRVKGQILRCHVTLVDRERVRYRGAMVFEEQLRFGEGPLSLNENERSHG